MDFDDDELFGVFESKKRKPEGPAPAKHPPKKRKIDAPSMPAKLNDKDAMTKPEYWVQFQQQVTEELEYEGCVHKVAYPPLADHKKCHKACTVPLPAEKPAKEFPYTLDSFQACAIESLRRNHHVLVAAHTSAGKTTVAEYGIALALQQNSRVIYTSPIKALSNQKYRDLKADFDDVGLMTGDVTINPGASCLVMTTEILRNMLYRGSQIVREISFVIFDEIHYMRDLERGVVWEEVLILTALQNLTFIFLSATIPNSLDFASWIAKLSNRICHVIYTEYRPTPLVHYMYPGGEKALYQVVDVKRNFLQDNFQKAISRIQHARGKKDKDKKMSKDEKVGLSVLNLVKMLVRKGSDPIIVFAFSRKACETYAAKLMKLDICNETEKALITRVFNSAMDSLSADDRQLPQVSSLLHFLKLGIGIHHSGLLPILKEIVELLFGEGLIKCLFATETFAMGVNMPAKTVVFSQVTKFDGSTFRLLSTGEYVQMSGRAGRRGKDAKGICIMMIDSKLEPADAKNMLRGVADPLHSAFHLSYNMLLNLTKLEGGEATYLIHRSFLQFSDTLKTPSMIKEIDDLEEKRQSVEIDNVAQVEKYHDIMTEIASSHASIRAAMNEPEVILPFLNPGRLVKITEFKENGKHKNFGWGLLLNFHRLSKEKLKTLEKHNEEIGSYLADVLLPCMPVGLIPQDAPEPWDERSCVQCEMQIIPVPLKYIARISALKIAKLPRDMKKKKKRDKVWSILKKLKEQYPNEDDIPLLDPIEDMKIRSKDFKKTYKQWKRKRRECREYISEHPTCDLQYDLFLERHRQGIKVRTLKNKLGDLQRNRQLTKKLRGMKQVLRRMGYLSDNGVLTLKGRVACEISNGNELVTTELLFNGVFRDLKPAQIGALFSCFAFQEKTSVNQKLPDVLTEPYKILVDVVKQITDIENDADLQIDAAAVLERFQPHLMNVTYQWCCGSKFSEICKMTNILEGSVVRALRRLEEMLGEMEKGCSVMGNEPLKAKFKHARQLMRRDIVFAASLYLI